MVGKGILRGDDVSLVSNEYNFNFNFRKYVDQYCKDNNCTPEDAFKDEQVKRMFWRYTNV